MLVLRVKYLQGPDQREHVLADHHAFIDRLFADGTFVAAGQLIDAEGAIIIATGTDERSISSMTADDPFVVHGYALYEIERVRVSRAAIEQLLDV